MCQTPCGSGRVAAADGETAGDGVVAGGTVPGVPVAATAEAPAPARAPPLRAKASPGADPRYGERRERDRDP